MKTCPCAHFARSFRGGSYARRCGRRAPRQRLAPRKLPEHLPPEPRDGADGRGRLVVTRQRAQRARDGCRYVPRQGEHPERIDVLAAAHGDRQSFFGQAMEQGKCHGGSIVNPHGMTPCQRRRTRRLCGLVRDLAAARSAIDFCTQQRGVQAKSARSARRTCSISYQINSSNARTSACRASAQARRSRPLAACGSPNRTIASRGGARSVRHSEATRLSSSI